MEEKGMVGANCKGWPQHCGAGDKRVLQASLQLAHSEMKNMIQAWRKTAQREEDESKLKKI